MAETDEERHKREEQERRAKRKAAKAKKSDSQREKEKRNQEYRRKIISGDKTAADSGTSASKYAQLMKTRAEGFNIDFGFRNAPPRPPVGPSYCGTTTAAVLHDQVKQYQAQNAVENNHQWQLHCEIDLGVPLAPSATNLQIYNKKINDQVGIAKANAEAESNAHSHSDELSLLDWQGSEGDTAAQERKRRQDLSRAQARAALAGQAELPKRLTAAAAAAAASQQAASKGRHLHAKKKQKVFSRVLKEDMQTWMKKTTYLSNDYSRRVHDFKSLAQTKQELELDLQRKQVEITKRRSAPALAHLFNVAAQSRDTLQHPNKDKAAAKIKPKKVFDLLPNVTHWGQAFTHVVMDKAPQLPEPFGLSSLKQGLVTNVQKSQSNARMSCQVMVPQQERVNEDGTETKYQAVHAFDLDVVPLKQQDAPHVHYCIWLDHESEQATYLPIASRIRLSTGRPVGKSNNNNAANATRPVQRRPLSEAEKVQREEQIAEVDVDLAEKHHLSFDNNTRVEDTKVSAEEVQNSRKRAIKEEHLDEGDDGANEDYGDDGEDSSGDEVLFGGNTKTIVAEP